MAEHRWHDMISIMDRALDLDPEERVSYINEVCKENPSLKEEVLQYLSAADASLGLWDELIESSNVLVNEITSSEAVLDIDEVFPPLQQAGPYRVIKLIARGGMGNVYLAERSDGQFERTVAIKILRHELSLKTHIKRFSAERNILSGLEHPKIARLYDGGVTADKRPYLVMEYVDGVPITTYCKEKKCSLKEILDLFKQVCNGVEYAHRNLIVHRDLKPDNILVKQDGTVKILDFGIAKILDEELTSEKLVQTKENLHMLSIQYAAPEQVTLEKITTATDVYALGLLLYEMIIGRPPFDLKGKNLKEAEQVICFGIPEKPSKHISDLRLSKKVRGDLDAIILKALKKEPDQRYSGAAQMMDEINRYLADLPISVRSHNFLYRAKKFVRRRPLAVMAGVIGLMFISGYLITLQLYTDRLETERNRAHLEAEKAETIADFVLMLFEANNPDVEEGEIPTVFELLERGVERAELLDDQPEISARMLDVIGQMYSKLGRFQDSEPLFRRVVSMRRTIHAEPHPDLAVSLDRLGDTLLRMDYFDEAEELLLEALEVAKASSNPVIESDILNDLGLVHYGRGNFAEAEEFHRRAHELRKEFLGDTHYRVGVSLHNLALAIESQYRMDEAEELFTEALNIKRISLEDVHSSVTYTMAQLGRVYWETGNLEKAEELLTETLEINRRRLGPQHPRIAENLNDLAALYSTQKDYPMAEELFREALAIREDTQESTSLNIATSLANLATVLSFQNKFEEALPLSLRAVNIARERWGTNHINTAIFIHNLATFQLRLFMYEDAELNFREALEMLSRTLPDTHPVNAHPMMRLGELLTTTGRAAEAESYLRKVLDLRVQAESDPADIAQAQYYLGINQKELSRFEEAETMLRNSLQTRIDVLGQDHPDVLTTQSHLDEVLSKSVISENGQ